jgi:hypothetical protein
MQQAGDYKDDLMDKIKADGRLIATDPEHHGNVKIPINCGVVFLLGLDFLEPKGWSEEQIEKLIYVAITRAGYQLFIPCVVENQFISKLKSCL